MLIIIIDNNHKIKKQIIINKQI